MMLTALIGTTLLALGPTQTTNVRTAADIVEVRAGMFDHSNAPRRDQIRYSTMTQGVVVAQMEQDGSVEWNAQSDRARLGGEDAPALIYVQVFDAVFAIDPFVAVPAGDSAVAKNLFNGSSLETDRALFDRRRIERTEELMMRLEDARMNWLRNNGFFNARTITRDGSAEPAIETSSIEPILKIERPADMPRGKSLEQVRSTPIIEGYTVASSSILDGDAPVRISTPFGTAQDVVVESAALNKASEPVDEPAEEIASR